MTNIFFFISVMFFSQCINMSALAVTHGKIVQPGEDPYPNVIALKVVGNDGRISSGTGTIVTQQSILTAAHVIENAKYIEIEVNGQSFRSQSIKVNQEYPHKQGNVFDVGLLYFNQKLPVKPIRLAFRGLEKGLVVEFVGFGRGSLTVGFDPDQTNISEEERRRAVDQASDRKRIGRNTLQLLESSNELMFVSDPISPLDKPNLFKENVSGTMA